MANYNFSNVVSQAREAIESGGSRDDSRTRILYPGEGVVQVRLLFNVKSNSVMRLIKRHNIDGTKIECESMYGKECPLCSAVNNIKAATNRDLWSLKGKQLGIAYAQYVGCSRDYDWGGYQAPQKGEVVLLMFPWTLYKELSGIIQRASDNIEEIIAAPAGRVISLSRDSSGDKIVYRAEIDPFQQPFVSADSDLAMERFLESLDNLNEEIYPSVEDPELVGKLKTMAISLESRYIGAVNSNVNEAVANNVNNFNNVQNNVDVIDPSTPSIVDIPNIQNNSQIVDTQPIVENSSGVAITNDGNPECFGNCNFRDKKCLLCNKTAECSQATNKK